MQFLYQNFLFLLIGPILFFIFFKTINQDVFQKYFTKDIIAKLSINTNYMKEKTRYILLVLSLIFMIISIARPVTNEKETSFTQEAVSFIVAIDVSKSMWANDIYPNRLEFAKKKLLDIIDYAKNNAIGIILFAKHSFILSPITQDLVSLKTMLKNFNTGINFDNGSNIFSTLETTQKLLKNHKAKNLLILSDGGNNVDFSKEIKYANTNNINVYTIALANKEQSPIKLKDGSFLTDAQGNIVSVALNEKIKDLSLATNASYINYSLNNSDVEQILDDINKTSKTNKLKTQKFKTYTELFIYPLSFAIFLLFLAFYSLPNLSKSSIIKNIVLCFIVFFTPSIKAFDFQNINSAKEAYKNQDYEKASTEFTKVQNTPEAKYNLANSLYKEKKYKKALKTYKSINTKNNKNLEFKKLHNMGNTSVKLEKLEVAKKLYEKALKIKEDKETKKNLKLVNKALKKNKQKKNKEKDNKEKKNKEKDNKEKDNKEKDNKEKDNKEKDNKEKDNKEKDNKEKDNKEKDNKEKDNKEKDNKEKDNKEKDNKNKKIKKHEISDLEEKKWLNKLNKDKTPILLQKQNTKNYDNTLKPW